MAPKKEKQPLKLNKKSSNIKKAHPVLPEKFMSLYYDHFDVAGSCSYSKHPFPSASPCREKDSSLDSPPSVEDSLSTNPS